LNAITVFSQVTHPRDTATSGWTLVNRRRRPSNGYLGKGKYGEKRC
jgi:hypothetical protein